MSLDETSLLHIIELIFLINPAIGGVNTPSQIDWCIVSSASHILYNQTCTDWPTASNKISWQAMLGEYESVQLLLHPSSVPTNFSISSFQHLLPTFSNDQNDHEFLSNSLMSFYQIGHVNCSETTRYGGSGGGWRPDPLFPLQSDTYGDTLPLDSMYGQSIHITIGPIPLDAVAGSYTGMVLVNFSNSDIPDIEIMVELEVVNITIPSTLKSSFQTMFSFSDGALSPFYDSNRYNLTEIKYQYFDFLTSYRIPPDELYQSSPRDVDDYIYLSSNTKWANLEDIESTANSIAVSMNQSTGSGCGPWSQVVIDKVLNQLNVSIAEMESRNVLIDHLYVYGFDEQPTSCKEGIQQLFGAVQKEWPQIRSAATLNWKDGEMMMDLPLNAWNMGYESFNESHAEKWVQSMDSVNGHSRSMWLYHCIEPSGIDYLNTFIERPLIESRLLFWFAASYPSVTGWLYYAVNLWRGCPTKGIPNKNIMRRLNKSVPFTDFDPANYIWCPRTDIFANGDGYFLYPGEHGPIATSRLMNIRNGLEDLELFRMIKDGDKMKELIHEMVNGPTMYKLDPVLMEKIREQAIQIVLAQMN